MRLKLAAAFLCALAGVWLSVSRIALTGASSHSDRFALLPLTAGTVLIALAAATILTVAARRARTAVFLALTGLIVLPWLPIDVPPAFLLWSGPMAILPWAAMLVTAGSGVRPVQRWQARHDPLIAGACAFLFFSACAWGAAPSVPGGDEPHYLIITQSLLSDGDLRIENNHARADYRAYVGGELRPDYLKRGIDGEIYSIHAPGLPALVAPAFLIGGYHGVVLFLIIVSAVGSALAWHVALLATGRREAAGFGWAVVTFATTTVFHTFSVYPDGVGGVLVLTGVWALLRAEGERTSGEQRLRPWLLHGAALALLPWLHSRFAVLGGILGALVLLRLFQTHAAMKKALVFLLLPIASAVAWLLFFKTIYGTFSPSAPYGTSELGSFDYIADGVAGLLFDQRFGLLTYAPALVCAAGGLVAMLVRNDATSRRRLAIELLLVIGPYVLLVTYFRMWWAGWSAPARFATPLVFSLAVPAAHAWTSMRARGTRASAIAALCYTALVTVLLVSIDGGHLAFNVRTEHAQLFEWLSRNADLTAALPEWSDHEAEFFRDIAIWCASMLAAWIALRSAASTLPLRGRLRMATATAAFYAAAAMLAATLSWWSKGVDGLAPLPAQLDLLTAAASDRRAIALGVEPPRTIARDSIGRELRLRSKRLPLPEDGPSGDQLLFAIPAVPAGDYHLRPRLTRPEGRISISIGSGGPIQTITLTSTSQVIALHLPVPVRAILVAGDEQAQHSVRGLNIEPIALVRAADRLTADFAHDAVRYGRTMVYFLDDRSFPEADAFWLGGGRSSSIVLQPDAGVAPTLFVRNAPAANTLTLEAGAWRAQVQLAAGEEREIQLPLTGSAMLVRLSALSGFVPAEVDPNSRDTRFLGVWLQVR
ncbi:MAG TPA: hypothetical protein VM791_16905 [Vicinamibacterales bacterium]|jgi:hypothetical protein|nr:hypothetical protein [Vicinamibacterales bacterium]